MTGLRVVRNCLRDRLEARTLAWVQLRLHSICKRCLTSDMNLLIGRSVAPGPVKEVLGQADVRKRPLEIRNP